MTSSIIVTISVLLLLAYVFDISSAKTRIPSVILLLILGWLIKQATDFFYIQIPDLSSILPILGTVGLILIVLEGSLELELNKSKLPFIGRISLLALLPLFIIAFGVAYAFAEYDGVSIRIGLINAIPLAIISSAIAIPSVQNLGSKNRETVTYESSLSDIFGVIFFNFVSKHDVFDGRTFGGFFLEILIMLVISGIATFGLAILLSKIKHPVKFMPIIILIILIYTIAKIYHLPALIFIMLFGLFLGNLDELKDMKFMKNIHPENMNKEVHKLIEITSEFTFLIRTLFFLVFGFLINTDDLLNSESFAWAGAIIGAIFLVRFIFLYLFKVPVKPLLFVAPRGLITILLFLSIAPKLVTKSANSSLIIQVIILSAVLMMLGLISFKPRPEIVASVAETPSPMLSDSDEAVPSQDEAADDSESPS